MKEASNLFNLEVSREEAEAYRSRCRGSDVPLCVVFDETDHRILVDGGVEILVKLTTQGVGYRQDSSRVDPSEQSVNLIIFQHVTVGRADIALHLVKPRFISIQHDERIFCLRCLDVERADAGLPNKRETVRVTEQLERGSLADSFHDETIQAVHRLGARSENPGRQYRRAKHHCDISQKLLNSRTHGNHTSFH